MYWKTVFVFNIFLKIETVDYKINEISLTKGLGDKYSINYRTDRKYSLYRQTYSLYRTDRQYSLYRQTDNIHCIDKHIHCTDKETIFIVQTSRKYSLYRQTVFIVQTKR